jgi:hypothetical protein
MVGELGCIDRERIPEAFEAVNNDFIVNLLRSGGYDAIMVVIDRFTKTGVFILCTFNFTAENAASMFFDRVIAMRFLTTKFITNRNPRLVRSFWEHLCKRLGIDHMKTTAFDAQAHGAVERLNRTLEVALRA